MKKLAFLLLGIVFLTGCVCLNPKHKQDVAVKVSTQRIIDELDAMKVDLAAAGESNTKVDQQIDKAISLAERLQVIFEYLEELKSKMSKTSSLHSNNKEVIPTE